MIFSKKTWGIILILFCSVINASSQFTLKLASLKSNIISFSKININIWLVIGYILYGFSTIILILALRKGPLSTLYPFLSLTYVWVIIFSPILFVTDSFSLNKLLGVCFIIIGIFFVVKENN